MLAVMAVGCRLGGVAHRGLLVALLRLVQAPRGSLVAHRAGHVAVGKVPHRRRMLALLSLVQRRGCGGVPSSSAGGAAAASSSGGAGGNRC